MNLRYAGIFCTNLVQEKQPETPLLSIFILKTNIMNNTSSIFICVIFGIIFGVVLSYQPIVSESERDGKICKHFS